MSVDIIESDMFNFVDAKPRTDIRPSQNASQKISVPDRIKLYFIFLCKEKYNFHDYYDNLNRKWKHNFEDLHVLNPLRYYFFT